MVPTSFTFLRRLLIADAAISGTTGILMLAGAAALQPILDLPEPLIRYSGLALLPFAAMVMYIAQPARLSRSGVWTVIVLNASWVVASVLLLVSGLVDPNVLGVAFVLVQAIAVAGLAELQYGALRKQAIANP